MSWDPGADLDYGRKLELLRGIAEASDYEVFIETGIYNGQCAAQSLRDLFTRCYVIDIDPENVKRANVSVAILGDSAQKLPQLLRSLGCPALFWLDAHPADDEDDYPPHPLLAELAAISAWEHGPASTVLVDDIRLLNGKHGWPDVWDVRLLADKLWQRVEGTDIMRLLPR